MTVLSTLCVYNYVLHRYIILNITYKPALTQAHQSIEIRNGYDRTTNRIHSVVLTIGVVPSSSIHHDQMSVDVMNHSGPS
jgi:hypothetical protein